MGWTVSALWVGPFPLYGSDRFRFMGRTVSALWVGPFPLTPHLVQGLGCPLLAAHRKVPRAFNTTRGTHLTHSLVQDWGHTLPHRRRT